MIKAKVYSNLLYDLVTPLTTWLMSCCKVTGIFFLNKFIPLILHI